MLHFEDIKIQTCSSTLLRSKICSISMCIKFASDFKWANYLQSPRAVLQRGVYCCHELLKHTISKYKTPSGIVNYHNYYIQSINQSIKRIIVYNNSDVIDFFTRWGRILFSFPSLIAHVTFVLQVIYCREIHQSRSMAARIR